MTTRSCLLLIDLALGNTRQEAAAMHIGVVPEVRAHSGPDRCRCSIMAHMCLVF